MEGSRSRSDIFSHPKDPGNTQAKLQWRSMTELAGCWCHHVTPCRPQPPQLQAHHELVKPLQTFIELFRGGRIGHANVVSCAERLTRRHGDMDPLQQSRREVHAVFDIA